MGQTKISDKNTFLQLDTSKIVDVQKSYQNLTHVPLALGGVGLSMDFERKKILLMRTSSFAMTREIKTLITLS